MFLYSNAFDCIESTLSVFYIGKNILVIPEEALLVLYFEFLDTLLDLFVFLVVNGEAS